MQHQFDEATGLLISIEVRRLREGFELGLM